MGAGHARSCYLNRKEGNVEGRASDWSEVVTRRSVMSSRVVTNHQTNTLDPDLDLPLWGCDVVGTLIESFVASSTPQSTNWVPDSLSPPTIMSVISDLHD
ncbi:hypothetical protein JHK85_054840 [Glycine max]|nr:hypothetical protein JHK85_054840 [Glycine max]